MKTTDRTLQLVNGGVHFFILVLKTPAMFQMVAKAVSFQEPCQRPDASVLRPENGTLQVLIPTMLFNHRSLKKPAVSPGVGWFCRKKHAWKEWKWKVPLETLHSRWIWSSAGCYLRSKNRTGTPQWVWCPVGVLLQTRRATRTIRSQSASRLWVHPSTGARKFGSAFPGLSDSLSDPLLFKSLLVWLCGCVLVDVGRKAKNKSLAVKWGFPTKPQ